MSTESLPQWRTDPRTDEERRLFQIHSLVTGVGRIERPNDGMDMLADAVLRILYAPLEALPGDQK